MKRRRLLEIATVILATATAWLGGCGPHEERVAWNVRVLDCGEHQIYHFKQPRLVLLLEGLAADGGEIGYQITVAGSGWSGGSGIGAYSYANGVTSIDIENYRFRITDRGTTFWSNDRVIANLPYIELTVIALDKDGIPRELRDGEREKIIRDATKPGVLDD